MKKIQCPFIEKSENVHKHFCGCCNGKQHIPIAQALKYSLRGLLVLNDYGGDATDHEMHNRIESYIRYFKNKYKYTGTIEFERVCLEEPISTLNACSQTLNFIDK